MLSIGKSSIKREDNIRKFALELAEASSKIDNYGLYNGKSGILIALHEASRFLKSETIKPIQSAIQFLQNDISENSVNTCDNFSDGIFGIGWVVNDLYKKGYIQENENEVMKSFDDELYKLIMYSKAATPDLNTGTIGRINYYLNRIDEDLKLSNKYHYVCNYEILMLLIDDFTSDNESLFISLQNKNISALKDNQLGERLANVFNLLQTLIKKNIHREITEKQWLQCLSQLIWFYKHTNEEAINEHADFQLNFLYITNCLLKLASQNEPIKHILLSKKGLLFTIADLKFNPANISELFHYSMVKRLITSLNISNEINLGTYFDNFFENKSYAHWPIGLAGISGLVCMLTKEKNLKLIESAFLI